jgi:phosphotransferase system enzyme I (PtsI)
MTIKGTGVSPGISIGKACVLKKNKAALTGVVLEDEDAVEREVSKYRDAVSTSVEEVKAIITQAESLEAADILEAQIELLNDPQIEKDVLIKIRIGRKNANDALIEVVQTLVQLFEHMNDEYLSARAADIQDIGDRILNNLNSLYKATLQPFEANTILIAEDLTPSDTITLDIKNVIGFITLAGSKISHAAIIAKSRGIPAIVGCGDALTGIKENDLLVMDGQTGIVLLHPGPGEIREYRIKKEAYQEKINLLKLLKNVPAHTTDGTKIRLFANISSGADLETAFDHGAEGVGLLRTELLFMGRESGPEEEEQFEFYKHIALKSKGKPVTVRTLDIGGDKPLPYLGLPPEQNPFLGYRAIRICLDRKDIFLTQLKAILRASVFGQFHIMFPMISNLREVRAAKEILAEAKVELVRAQIAFDEKIRVGIMIEIPSAAITADMLAKEVDFFSIGTNDLCQYTLAVDRMNEQIKDLYDPYNPAVLRLIKYVIDQGKQHQIAVGMCGEFSSDPLAALLLLGMGLGEFSMNAASIPFIKQIIIQNSLEKAVTICSEVMKMNDSRQIIAYLQSFQS